MWGTRGSVWGERTAAVQQRRSLAAVSALTRTNIHATTAYNCTAALPLLLLLRHVSTRSLAHCCTHCRHTAAAFCATLSITAGASASGAEHSSNNTGWQTAVTHAAPASTALWTVSLLLHCSAVVLLASFTGWPFDITAARAFFFCGSPVAVCTVHSECSEAPSTVLSHIHAQLPPQLPYAISSLNIAHFTRFATL